MALDIVKQSTSSTLSPIHISNVENSFCIDETHFFPYEELHRLVKLPSVLLHYYMKYLEVIFGIILLAYFCSKTVWRHSGSKVQYKDSVLHPLFIKVHAQRN